jgi:hypothetical protein
MAARTKRACLLFFFVRSVGLSLFCFESDFKGYLELGVLPRAVFELTLGSFASYFGIESGSSATCREIHPVPPRPITQF